MESFKQILLAGLLLWLLFSCNSEDFTLSPYVRLEFSVDTVSFDTVFTSLGSTTQYFKVRNTENKSVIISDVYLAGGEKSPFRLNINGELTNKGTDVEIYANDSIYVFVEVTVDPTGMNLPMVVHDSIVFNVNDNTQDVDLIAFGQDFHLFNGEVIKTQHWINDKPYLVYNSILVDSLETLTIAPGCRIHFHEGSGMFVSGTLKVNGTFEEPVTFQGDRLEYAYKNVPGQWGAYSVLNDGSLYVYGGLHFLAGSINNEINYSIIKNAEKGIQVDTLGASENPVLTLRNTRIENMSLNCMDARTTYIKASNCIFANSGSYSVALNFGGDYEFNHCTIANYYADTRKEPALFFNNYYTYNKKTYSFNLQSVFSNCIVYGNKDGEISYDVVGDSEFEAIFNSCLLNSNLDSDESGFSFLNTEFNKDPVFVNAFEHDYAIDSLSPARNAGDVNVALLYPLDLNHNSRLADEDPDLGALEWMPKKEQ